MPTFRQDNKLGDSVPLIKTPDIGDKQVTERKLADGSVTSSKLSTEIANMLSLLTTRISAFKVADNLSSLPTEENTIGWLVDNHLYVYVGNGSTPESGMYQDCGELRGPQGIQGEQGLSGLNGKSAYDIWTEQPGNEDKSEIDFLEFTRGSKGDKGDQGERGYDISNIEQIVKSTEDGGKNIIRVTRSDGWSKVFEILNGSKGSKGDKGTSIVKLEQTRKTTESSGLNTIEATLGDGTKESFEIYNGAKGEQGDKGEKGDKGDQGEIGPQGNSGIADASNKVLVNDAITGGETDFLSAEVGKLGILTYDCSKGGTVTHATLQDAINSVPTTFQKVGLTITYKSGNTIYRYTLKANAWSADPANWFSVEDKLSNLSSNAIKLSISTKKVDTGNNLLDVSKIVEGAGIWAGINSDCFFGNSNKNFKLSPFIRVHKEGLCTANTARTQSGLSSYIVFDENLKSLGRNGQDTDIYTYQEGDAYIRFCWNVTDASNLCVCIGTDYKYEEYTDTHKTDVEIKNLSTALANTLKQEAIQDESIKSSNFDMIESFLVDARFLLNESVNFGVTSGNLKFGESSSLTIFKVDNDGNFDVSSRFEVQFEYSKAGLYRLRRTTNYYLNKPISYDIVLLLDGHDYRFSANTSKLNKFVYEEHEGYIKEQEEKRYSLEDIKNGKKISLRNSYDNLGANIEYLSEKAFTITTSEVGNRWSCLNVPIIGAGKYIYIEADIYKYEKNGSLLDSTDINLWVTNGTKEYSPDNCVQVLTHIQSGSHVKYVLDPSYYSIYKGWNTFNVWIETAFKNEELLKVLNFEIYSFDEEKKFANISGENALEIFSSVDEKLKSVSSNKDNQYLVSPNGKKFELSIGDNGTLKTISTIPSKGIFIGNSLLKGFNPLNQNVFGMAATNITDDYYHIIDAYIKNNLNSGYMAKISASFTKDVDKLEQITDASKIEEYVNDLMEHIDGTEDLVCIQLGDNIQNINLFKSWGNLLLSSIRKKCINARVAWIGVWYGDDTKYEILKAICVNNGVHFISFAGIPSSATQNKIGGVFYSPTHGPIENVTSVNKISDNDDGSYKAEVIFSVNSNSYTATIPDMKSYHLEDGVLVYDSKYDVIKNAGVASHPNNEGHKLIALRFISEMF